MFWFLAQETTGKSLEEMGELFGDTMMVQTLHEKLTEDPTVSETPVDSTDKDVDSRVGSPPHKRKHGDSIFTIED